MQFLAPASKGSGGGSVRAVLRQARPVAPHRRWPLVAGIVLTTVVVGIAAAILLTRSTPESVQQKLTAELERMGLASITVRVDKDWEATLSGSATNATERERARSFVAGFEGIRNVSDGVALPPQPAVAQDQPSSQPAIADDSLASSTRRVEPAPMPAAKADPAKLEGEINRALRKAGLGGVTCAVSDDFQATIKGSVGSSNQKGLALEIVNGFPEIRKVRDIVFIVN